MRPLILSAVFAALLASLATFAARAVEIDGRIDSQEWAGAQHITDFRQTQPLSREPASQPTEAWILATAEGLAIGFRNVQPPSIPRTRQQAQRDQGGAADRVNVYVDFDGDGRVGYNLVVLLSGSIADTTITNESRFSSDWDGDWRAATAEDGDTWSAEILIPWHIAPMQKADGDTRTIAISLDRVIGATGERMSWPAISFTEQRFLSAFEKIQVPVFSQSLLAVTPYVVGVYDAVGRRSSFDAGGDVFWKPSGQFQLSGTINPDFGQVESDQLVVNFGAVESFFSDKRPFFTENQSFFDVPFGSLGGANRLIYTRRVGGLADDGSGSGDVTAAVKLNGSAGAINYGVFAATEADDVGRGFFAARATRDFATHGVGAMMTRVDRPFLQREATVYEFDHRWAPNAKWNVRSTVVASDIDQAGIAVRDSGGQVQIDYDAGSGWRQQLFAVHLGRDLQLNDFGFLDRNNFNYARYEAARRITDLPETSAYSSHNWRYAISRRSNDRGMHIADAWAVNRGSELRDGGNQFLEIAGWTAGRDDLITRGHGAVKVPAKLFLYAERFRPRKGHWEWFGNVRYSADGLGGTDEGAIAAGLRPTFHVSDSLSLFSGIEVRHSPDWLLWRGGNLLGSYRSDMIFLNSGLAWLIDPKQELRVRLEAIGLDARVRQAWRVAADGEPVPVDDPIADFGLRNLGFQIRYRYEFAPLSNLFIAYVRGGAMLDQGAGGFDAVDQFGEAFGLRESEQLLIKLSYRFEL